MESEADLQGVMVAKRQDHQTLASLNRWAMKRPINPI